MLNLASNPKDVGKRPHLQKSPPWRAVMRLTSIANMRGAAEKMLETIVISVEAIGFSVAAWILIIKTATHIWWQCRYGSLRFSDNVALLAPHAA
ncbi:hypothetical protein CO657_32565 (plasmid) [Rhizobium acidisoli]|uniref:Uncharacterized protein n=1 Tax=Rhizobium acidisoli TaxID=1538158 RepID=A0AAE6C5F1_9HYPH|nr:hypothetical protein [Rhizobium acidisoli]QAS82560.1 hypothetical protein CO657_32565 [Rhizobium acidisoli]